MSYGRYGQQGPYDMQAPPAPGQPGAPTASLNPPNNMERANNPIYQWTRNQTYWPEPLGAIGPGITRQLRRRPLAFTGTTINVETTQSIRFDVPGPIYQLTGSARDSTGAAFPVGVNALDTFLVRFSMSNGEQLDTMASLGSTLLGSGAFPCQLSSEAWQFDNGSTLQVSVTPLFANLQVYIVGWHMEVRGPTNLART